MHIPNQEIQLPLLTAKNITLYIKREDTIHPHISGNKFRKLKYNLIKAGSLGYKTILTFGGAFSNHIAATAHAGKLHQFNTIGVIRGDELQDSWKGNPTLRFAKEQGMEFCFVSREAYSVKDTKAFLAQLRERFGIFYTLPEGGTNPLAVQGCEEVLTTEDTVFDMVCCSVGTGGTLAGLINSKNDDQQVLGFPALKGDFLKKDIRNFVQNEDWDLVTDYHFGGYAKVTPELVQFINEFKECTGVPLDPIYTGKMVFGILDLVKKDHFMPGTKILAIHTGGLQGIAGMNKKLKKKNLPSINV